MKTNQIMIRQMGEFVVEQRTKDGFFNATGLLRQWNAKSGAKKEVTKFLDLESTSELVSHKVLVSAIYDYVKRTSQVLNLFLKSVFIWNNRRKSLAHFRIRSAC